MSHSVAVIAMFLLQLACYQCSMLDIKFTDWLRFSDYFDSYQNIPLNQSMSHGGASEISFVFANYTELAMDFENWGYRKDANARANQSWIEYWFTSIYRLATEEIPFVESCYEFGETFDPKKKVFPFDVKEWTTNKYRTEYLHRQQYVTVQYFDAFLDSVQNDMMQLFGYIMSDQDFETMTGLREDIQTKKADAIQLMPIKLSTHSGGRSYAHILQITFKSARQEKNKNVELIVGYHLIAHGWVVDTKDESLSNKHDIDLGEAFIKAQLITELKQKIQSDLHTKKEHFIMQVIICIVFISIMVMVSYLSHCWYLGIFPPILVEIIPNAISNRIHAIINRMTIKDHQT